MKRTIQPVSVVRNLPLQLMANVWLRRIGAMQFVTLQTLQQRPHSSTMPCRAGKDALLNSCQRIGDVLPRVLHALSALKGVVCKLHFQRASRLDVPLCLLAEAVFRFA